MIKKLLVSLGVIFLVGGVSLAQTGTFKGSVKDPEGKPLQYVEIYLLQDGKNVNMAVTDMKGEYQIIGVLPGTYDVRALGKMPPCNNEVKLTGVTIQQGDVKFIEEFIFPCITDLPPIVITAKPPLINEKAGKIIEIDGKTLATVPGKNITAALASMEGVTSTNGQITSVRGNRSDGHQTIIDGVRVRGTAGISMSSVENLELIMGGIPPEYGDGTSFTVITTRGIPSAYSGSVELRGSVEGYNNFSIATFVSGPLLKGKTERDPARIGFMLSADAGINQDGYPARGGTWMIKDDVRERIEKTPILYNEPLNPSVYHSAAEYLTEDDFVKRRTRKNAYDWNYLVQAKFDFLAGKPNENMGNVRPIRISLGGSYEFIKNKNWGIGSSLMNYANNSESQGSTLRTNARISHRVFSNFSDTSILKNVMYDITVNYTLYNSLTQDAVHKDNIFRYGHIGYFERKRSAFYQYMPEYQVIDSNQNLIHVWYGMTVLQTIYDSLMTFKPGAYNPLLTNYTQTFCNTYSPDDLLEYGLTYNEEAYRLFGALMNGVSPAAAYGLYSVPGAISSSYSKGQSSTLGAKANLSLTLGDHEIKLGFELDRVSARGYGVAAADLWTLMRNLQNAHMDQLDILNPIISRDTIKFNWLVNESAQGTFDKNLRTALGKDPSGKDFFFLDIDNYEPETFNLDMFSAEELLLGTSGGGSQMVSYYGYDYTGKKYKGKTSIRDFFTPNKDGVYEYNIGTYDPIYMGFYVQDHFTIKNLRIKLGLRIDRFDANQDVLKDPFLFREGMTIKDLRDGKTIGNQSFAGRGEDFTRNLLYSNEDPNRYDDYVVYIGEKDVAVVGGSELLPSDVIAYRNGLQWYDAKGQEISNPSSILGATGGPVLFTAPEAGNLTKVSADAFTDYIPHWSFMPRLSFSFPVSDNSQFTAHYNIITNRPTNLQINPVGYLFIEKLASDPNYLFTNPNLKPQKSIDYEIGFNQKLGDNSAIGIAAYYSEKRDQVQVYRYTGAYPTTYYSYANIDFGTVQGFSFSYIYRNNKNLSLRASYTIQFAKGTGSDANSQLSIVQSGQPNLRTLTNLSFDQRHRLSAFLDYRFGGGADYDQNKGPKTSRMTKDGKSKDIRWLENTGFTIVLSGGSGLPYSRSVIPYSTFISGQKPRYEGSMNGSFKPWNFQCDLRIDKMFILKMKDKDKEGKQKQGRNTMLLVYLDIQNIFNLKNTLSVYDYTGNANDDGYLSSFQYQKQINAQLDVASFINYYRMMVNNPYNYGLPTRVNLGVQFSF